MLHVTNGDCAVERIRAAGMEGTLLPWRDVLHDGPVPAGLPLERLSAVRADWLASRGGGDAAEVRRSFAERDRILTWSHQEDEVVLWFEHDLYDQLQLLQVLDWFADHPHPRLTLINPPEYLGQVDVEHARELFDAREPVTRGQLALGRWAWDAFRGPDPRQMETVIYAGDARLLPHLPEALLRLLQEYPSVRDGLSRSERQALQAFARHEPRPLREAYPDAHHEVEDAVWMGDLSFAGMVDALARGPNPLLRWVDDAPSADSRGVMERRAAITGAGREVLGGKADAVWMNGIDRWIGGVHLSGREVRWRWDDDESRIVER